MPSVCLESVLGAVQPMGGKDPKLDHPRVVVMGSAGVGKTSIVQQFLYDRFPVDHVPTVEEMHCSVYDVADGASLSLDVLDTSGSYEFPAMRRLAVKTGDAFVLVYSIADKESFEVVCALRDLILDIRQEDTVPIVVVGNKADLEDGRAVSKEIAETVVAIDWENGFVETSAKSGLNVVQVFKAVLEQAHICYALGPAVERRRKSLPAQPTHPKVKHAIPQKRHSCSIQ